MKRPSAAPRRRTAQHVVEQALRLIDTIRQCRKRISQASDAEALHDYRVATRRLGSMMAPFARLDGYDAIAGPLKRVKRCLQHSNAQRDLEVQLILMRDCATRLAEPALIVWLDAQAARQAELLSKLLEQLTSEPVYRAMQKLRRRLPDALMQFDGPTLRRAVRARHAALMQHVDAHLALGEAIFDEPHHWHTLRLVCKQLRYLCECHGALLGGNWKQEIAISQAVQDALGELRDADLLLTQLETQVASLPQTISLLRQLRDERLTTAHAAVRTLAHYVWQPRLLRVEQLTAAHA